MDDKTKQILLDVLDNLNDSKYELENLNKEEIKKRLNEIIDDLDDIINKIEELIK